MSILNSKFNVLRGWGIGQDSAVDLSKAWGTGLTFTPGTFGMVHTDGTIIFPPAPPPLSDMASFSTASSEVSVTESGVARSAAAALFSRRATG